MTSTSHAKVQEAISRLITASRNVGTYQAQGWSVRTREKEEHTATLLLLAEIRDLFETKEQKDLVRDAARYQYIRMNWHYRQKVEKDFDEMVDREIARRARIKSGQ